MDSIASDIRAKACGMPLKRCALKPKAHRFCLNAHHIDHTPRYMNIKASYMESILHHFMTK